MSSTTSATPSASTSASASLQVSGNLKIVGIILAITSGLLIGSSFVFKKKGLMRSQAGHAGEGVAYLKSPLWWIGMSMMILGELCNFAAYSFVEALVVTPLGALSVVICAILSSIFLNEKLSFFGWLGCALCIIGSVIIALNGPQEPSVGQIVEFQALFLSPGFLVFGSLIIATSLVIIFYFAPRYGKKSMLWYIFVCSMIGGISVSVTTGLGAAIVTTFEGDNQFKHWFIYFLLVFIIVTLLTEVYYLNMALALFNTAMVTPTYYVIFTFFSMITTIILFKGLKASAAQIITLVMGFFVICFGITILQMSKVDPTQLNKLDRRSTILLQAARRGTEKMEEKDITSIEDPGIDAIRGSSGLVGSIIRAKSARRISQSTASANTIRSRHGPSLQLAGEGLNGLQRHQLYDNPVPNKDIDSERGSVMTSPGPMLTPKAQTIKFGTQDVVHTYNPTSSGAATAVHQQREASHHNRTSPLSTPRLYPADGQPSTSDVEVHGLRTAPALSFDGVTHLPQSYDPFANSPATTIGSSFADAYQEEEDEREAAWNRTARGRLMKQPSERRYPLSGGDDDRDESIGLVSGPSVDDDYDDDHVRRGGIRLVAPSPRRG